MTPEVNIEEIWLIELRPAFKGHPPFPATYYAGWMNGPECARTHDARSAPRFARKEDAEKVAGHLLGTLSCIWKAVAYCPSQTLGGAQT